MADGAKKRSREPDAEVPYTDDLPPNPKEHDVSQQSISFTHAQLIKQFDVADLRKNGWAACTKDLVMGKILEMHEDSIVIKNSQTKRRKTIPRKTSVSCCEVGRVLREKSTGRYFVPTRRDGCRSYLRMVLQDGAPPSPPSPPCAYLHLLCVKITSACVYCFLAI